MQLIHLNPKQLPTLPPLAMTIGNYDGVHLGHQALLTALANDAKQMGFASAVMIFEPQPREFFAPHNPPARLTSLDEKAAYIAELGVDYLIVASFDDEFRSLSASDFAMMLKGLNARHLVLGDDFRFGHDRAGDKAFLAAAGFSVDSLDSIMHDNQRVSSSLVRQALADGRLDSTKGLLGRDYAITGRVVHGDKIGRTLDFPTANIALNRIKPALHGVYGADVFAYRDGVRLDWAMLAHDDAVGVAGVAQGSLFGAVSVGLRPSVGGQDWRIEVHLPKFDGNLYDVQLTVVFRYFLHGERKYDGMDALKAGISQDVAELLAWRVSVSVE